MMELGSDEVMLEESDAVVVLEVDLMVEKIAPFMLNPTKKLSF